jgi:hypothetical protein
VLACSKQSALLSLKSISRVIQWMDQARAHATRIAQRLSPRDSTDTHRRRGREELQEELQEEHRNQVDVFRKFGINSGISVGASSELRSMGCLPPPHSDSGSPLSDRGWSATAAQRRRTSPSRAPPRTPSSLAGACRSHGGGSRPARPSQPRCCQWQFARKSKFEPGLAVFEPQFFEPKQNTSRRCIASLDRICMCPCSCPCIGRMRPLDFQ